MFFDSSLNLLEVTECSPDNETFSNEEICRFTVKTSADLCIGCVLDAVVGPQLLSQRGEVHVSSTFDGVGLLNYFAATEIAWLFERVQREKPNY